MRMRCLTFTTSLLLIPVSYVSSSSSSSPLSSSISLPHSSSLADAPLSTNNNNVHRKRKKRRRKRSSTDASFDSNISNNEASNTSTIEDGVPIIIDNTIKKQSADIDIGTSSKSSTGKRKRKRRRKEDDESPHTLVSLQLQDIVEEPTIAKINRQKRKDAYVDADTNNASGVLLPIDEDNLVHTHDTLDEKQTTDCNEDYNGDYLVDDVYAKNLSENNADEFGSIHEDSSSSSSSSTINVTRNESSESMTYQDDSNPNNPTTYIYNKQSEEEMIEEILPAAHPLKEDESTSAIPSLSSNLQDDGHVIKASTISSKQHENIQLIEGNSNNGGHQTVTTVKVSRQRKEQTVHITAKSHTKKSSLHKARKAATTGTVTQGTGKDGECLRRIKREWKDAVKSGIAYDWTNMRTINTQSKNSNNEYVRIGPFGKNLLRWHFSVAGPANSVYEGGVYHGRVLLPKDYPGSPPRVQVLTPSGRFICGADICLSASNYHPETWSPRWTVISLVNALRLHMLTTANEIGGVMASDDRRREYATASRSWILPGVVDHGQMVMSGIFPVHDDDNECDEEDSSMDDSVDISLQGKKMEAIKSEPKQQSPSGVHPQLHDDDIDASPDSTTKTKQPFNSSKASKQTKSTTKSKAAKTNDNAVVAKNRSEEEILPYLFKRIIIEMLKLPLRVVSILLKALIRIESYLRAILDSF